MRSNAVLGSALLILLTVNCSVLAAEYSLVGDSYPPYQYKENGELKGFSFDVLKAVLAMNGDHIFRAEIYPWKRALYMLKKNNANILISANYNKDRLSFAHYPSEPMISSPWYFWKRQSDALKFETFDDLLGKQIGVVQGYTYTTAFWDFARKNRLYNDIGNYSDNTNLSNLSQGKYDLAIAEYGNGLYLKKNLQLTNIVPLTDTPLKEDGLFALFNKDHFSQQDVERFSGNLQKFKKSPQYHAIYQKYFQ